MIKGGRVGGLSIIYGLLVKPSLGIRMAAERHSLRLVLLIIFLSCISTQVADTLIFSQDPDLALINLSSGLVFKIFSTLVILFLSASVLHFVAEGLKGKGKVSTFFLTLGCSLLPGILTSPLSLIAAAIGSFTLKAILYLIFKIIIFAWVITLQILALREVYQLSPSRAILAYFIPQIGILFLVILLFSLLISTLIILTLFTITP